MAADGSLLRKARNAAADLAEAERQALLSRRVPQRDPAAAPRGGLASGDRRSALAEPPAGSTDRQRCGRQLVAGLEETTDQPRRGLHLVRPASQRSIETHRRAGGVHLRLVHASGRERRQGTGSGRPALRATGQQSPLFVLSETRGRDAGRGNRPRQRVQ